MNVQNSKNENNRKRHFTSINLNNEYVINESQESGENNYIKKLKLDMKQSRLKKNKDNQYFRSELFETLVECPNLEKAHSLQVRRTFKSPKSNFARLYIAT